MMRNKMAVGLVSALLLAAPATAGAQATGEAYGGPNNVAGIVQGEEGGNPPATTSQAGGSLPFTGADLSVLLAAGVLLTLFGFGLRRLTHRPSEV